MVKLGNWHDKIGTSRENSPNREAPNKHTRGAKKYKEMIDKDSKNADRYKNLPFSFTKPPKKTQHRRDVFMVCEHCSDVEMVNMYTVGKVCGSCSKYTSVGDSNRYFDEESLVAALKLIYDEVTILESPLDEEGDQ